MSSSSTSSSEKKETLLFHVELNEVRLLQKALRPLYETAYFPDDMSLAGKIRDSGHFCISPDGVLIASTTSFPPHLDAYLELPRATFAALRCHKDHVLRLNLRLLEDRIAATTVNGCDGVSACFSGEKYRHSALLYSLRDKEGFAVHSSEIPLICSYPGFLATLDWSDYSYQLSIEMPTETFKQLINSLSLYGFAVRATVTITQIMFRVVNEEVVLRAEAEVYKILRSRSRYPYLLEFGLHQKSAFLNAASLSDRVRLHQLLDLRTVLEVPVKGLGSILFCFKL
ncbi:uncharacterized protein LOC112187589 [Rosa chinensis]|uniref:uncharacterized protein LOC112187589 n=2 Tax=Rosa TaxID=3764 RepID=UPI001AD93834|nr:uncharacterized protein LOC112187589 [Rosa chinensis]